MPKPVKPKLESRTLKNLRPHPLQAKHFDDMPQHELQRLADSIGRRGLREPIEILPANKAGLPPDIIISGLQRSRALALRGETETMVLVRHDLATVDAATIERELIASNLDRRHLHSLDLARLVHRLFELERGRRGSKLRPDEEAEARERVAQEIGLSGRHLQRLLNIRTTPSEVQEAVRRGELPVVTAEHVAKLPAAVQRQLARRLREGEPAKAVWRRSTWRLAGEHSRPRIAPPASGAASSEPSGPSAPARSRCRPPKPCSACRRYSRSTDCSSNGFPLPPRRRRQPLPAEQPWRWRRGRPRPNL